MKNTQNTKLKSSLNIPNSVKILSVEIF